MVLKLQNKKLKIVKKQFKKLLYLYYVEVKEWSFSSDGRALHL